MSENGSRTALIGIIGSESASPRISQPHNRAYGCTSSAEKYVHNKYSDRSRSGYDKRIIRETGCAGRSEYKDDIFQELIIDFI